jgi:Tfp pilus assembly protein PilO
MGRGHQQVSRVSWIDPLGAAFCVLLTVALYLLAVEPVGRTQAARAGVREELTRNHEKIAALKTVAEQLSDSLASTRQATAQSRAYLRPVPRMNQRVAELTQLIADCRLNVDHVQIGEALNRPLFVRVPVTITGKGRYEQCLVFLQRLKRDFPDFTLATIDISGTPAQPDDLDAFSLELAWFATSKPDAQNAQAD